MSKLEPSILVVEDDHKLAELVMVFLSKQGFAVSLEPRGDRAAERILAECPDLVVLDVMLPGAGGVEVCRRVRGEYSGPILMLTALGDEDDEVLGLDTGADDYLTKPVRPRVLLSHINALLRRQFRADSTQDADVIDTGAISIDKSDRTVTVQGRRVSLTTAEFDMLWLLACHCGQPVTREHIFEQLRGIPYDGLDRSIDLRINRIRRKLGDDGKDPRWIKSVRAVGYMLVAGS